MRLRLILNQQRKMYSKGANTNWKGPVGQPAGNQPVGDQERKSVLSGQYAVPATSVEVRESVRRSRFITSLARAASRTEALAFVQEVRKLHPGATHHCWAFNAGAPSSTAHVGMSDDGEPHGTAGRPMLTVLLHSGVGEVVAVCARYYGGVKLGTGGLARAYAGGVRRALEACPRIEKVERVPISIVVTYDVADSVERALAALDAVVTERDFAAEVRYRCLIATDRRSELVTAIADVTAGRGVVSDDPR